MEETTEDNGRNPDGTFKEGWKGGPGRPRGRMTWQDYADRIDHFLQNFTRGEIKKIVLDPDEFDKFVSRDAMIIQTMAEAFQADGLMSRKELLNRVIGEAIKREELTGINGTKLFGNDPRAEIESKLVSDAPARREGTET